MMRTSTGSIRVTKIAQKHNIGAAESGRRRPRRPRTSEIAILPTAMASAMTRLFSSITVDRLAAAPLP